MVVKSTAGLVLTWLSITSSIIHGVCPLHVPMDGDSAPVELHWPVQPRHLEDPHPQEGTLTVRVSNVTLTLTLKKNRLLLVSDRFSAFHFAADGSRVTTALNQSEACHYQGHVVGVKGSAVSASTCPDIQALIGWDDLTFELLPSGGGVGGHELRRVRRSQGHALTCGVTEDRGREGRPRVAESLSPEEKKRRTILTETKFLELVLVADYAEFVKLGRDVGAVRRRLMQIANHVDTLYRALSVRVLLVAVEIWSEGDAVSVSADTASTLARFSAWRDKQLRPRTPHDNAQLVSGVDFAGDTVGLAYVGTVCGSQSAGINQDHSDGTVPVSCTLAHELGHNLGMSHDSGPACHCPIASDQGGCLLAPSLSPVSPRAFSSCSVSSLEELLLEGRGSCLRAPPPGEALPPVVGGARCGNAIVESGEQCDCGGTQECSSSCCDAATCRLTSGSQCDVGPCCSQCKFVTGGPACRESRGPCDAAERCDGRSRLCPPDRGLMDGAGGRGGCPGGARCRGGACPPSLDEQCRGLWGPGSVSAPDSCFRGNQRGDAYGNCGRKDGRFTACSPQDSPCGKLPCVGGSQYPVTGSALSVGSCRLAGINPGSGQSNAEDVSLVSQGSLCGPDKVCVDQRCREGAELGAELCAEGRCHGHGVCDNVGGCECDAGWAPPQCETKTAGTTGTVLAIVIPLLLIILSVPLIVVAKRRGFCNPARRQNTYTQHLEEINKDPERQAKRPPPPPPTKPSQVPDHLPLVLHAVNQSPQVRPRGAPPPAPKAALKPPAAPRA